MHPFVTILISLFLLLFCDFSSSSFPTTKYLSQIDHTHVLLSSPIVSPNFPTSDPSLQQACASLSTCDTCYSTTGCHWCSNDNKCHVYGSIYGCIAGASCPKPECIRSKPQNIGTAHLSASFVLLIIFLFLSLFIVLTTLVHFFCFGCLYVRKCCGWDSPHDLTNTNNPTTDMVFVHASSDLNQIPFDFTNNNNNTTLTNNHSTYTAPIPPTTIQQRNIDTRNQNISNSTPSSPLLHQKSPSSDTYPSTHLSTPSPTTSNTIAGTMNQSSKSHSHSQNLVQMDIEDHEQHAQWIPKRKNKSKHRY